MNALVVGGAHGIGFSVVKELIAQDKFEHIYVIGNSESPFINMSDRVTYHKCDLNERDYSICDTFPQINALFINAGIGHLGYFQDFSEQTIQDMFQINTIAPLRIVKKYYSQMLSEENFYCYVISSISGHIISPLFSIYSATKASLSRFIESINIELEMQGSTNRILDVSPGYIEGTSFDGNTKIDTTKTDNLAKKILSQTFAKKEIYIPEYNAIYKDVLERHCQDKHQFGIQSYKYKINRLKKLR